MKISTLYNKINDENINYINASLISTRGAIVHYNNITAIILDNKQVKNYTSENTVLIQEFGHYLSGAYYHTNSQYDLIDKQEHKADKKAWNEFFPYGKIKSLMNNGYTTATAIAEYFEVEVPYMAKCLNYYYNNSHGFTDENIYI